MSEAGERARGVVLDGAVFDSDDVKDAAVRAYPDIDKKSDGWFRHQQLRRIAFRAGAAWYAKERVS